MRRNLLLIIMAVATLASVGCREQLKKTDGSQTAPKTSIGEAYELFVICNDNHWNDHIQAAISETFECEVPGLSRPEKYFHVVDHKSFDDVNDVERKHCNLLAVRIDPTNSGTTITSAEDVNASQQLVVTIHSTSAAEAAQYIRDNAYTLRDMFEQNERMIHFRTVSASESPEAMEIISDLTGIDMHVPGGFTVATPKEDILKWFVRKYPNKQQHIFVFTEECEDINTVSAEQLEQSIDNHISIISVEDEEGSYMCVSKNREIFITPKNINGRLWYEIRCCWRVEGYPMGGPLVSYSTYDETNKRMITIAFALFSPEQMQRHDMAQLESLIYLTK